MNKQSSCSLNFGHSSDISCLSLLAAALAANETYTISGASIDFQSAITDCASRGQTLARIETEAQLEKVKTVMRKIVVDPKTKYIEGWLALRKKSNFASTATFRFSKIQAAEAKLRWMDGSYASNLRLTREEITFDATSANCIALMKDTRGTKLVDDYCSTKYSVLCKRGEILFIVSTSVQYNLVITCPGYNELSIPNVLFF